MLKNIPRHFLTLLTGTITLLLLASVVPAYVAPKHLSVFAYAGFFFPFLWVGSLLILIIHLIRRNWRKLTFVLLALILTANHFGNTWQINNLFSTPQSQKPNVTIMSFNTRMFDYYDWTKQKDVIDNVLTFVRQKNPDIVCFQEFFSNDKKEKYSEHRIVSRLNAYKYRHIEYNVVSSTGKRFGQATFSKYPITGQKRIKFEGTSNFSIQTDISIDGKTVRVFNNHLESIRLNAKNYNFIDSINLKSDAERKRGFIEISDKLSHALEQRGEQAKIISQHIANSPYPVLVCGDFNDTPVSYVYRTMRGDLSDAFCQAGNGIGGTYNGKLPSFRIDYIFHDEAFETMRFEVYPLNYSDHYPIWADITLSN